MIDVSIHPPPIGEGYAPPSRVGALLTVSIHPPPYRRGELIGRDVSSGRTGFNPPPALSARGTPTRDRRVSACFNPPPALSARGTTAVRPHELCDRVSIHPPLCRRGEQGSPRPGASDEGFESTPRFIGEGNPVLLQLHTAQTVSNPPPALSARGTDTGCQPPVDQVSIHPPLYRRGEHPDLPGILRLRWSFNPPPALSATGERPFGGVGCWRRPKFQSTPRFIGEGNTSYVP